jgi:hypothetical protein
MKHTWYKNIQNETVRVEKIINTSVLYKADKILLTESQGKINNFSLKTKILLIFVS